MINLERGLGAEQDEVEDLEDDESGLPSGRADAAAVNGKRGVQVKRSGILPALLAFPRIFTCPSYLTTLESSFLVHVYFHTSLSLSLCMCTFTHLFLFLCSCVLSHI